MRTPGTTHIAWHSREGLLAPLKLGIDIFHSQLGKMNLERG